MVLPIKILFRSILNHVAIPLVKNNYNIKILDQRIEDDWRTTLQRELKNRKDLK